MILNKKISILALLLTFLFACSTNNAETKKNENAVTDSKVETEANGDEDSDVYTKEDDIDVICEKLDADAEAGKFTLTDLKTTCSEDDIEASVKKYFNAKKELQLIILTSENDEYYQYYEYYFDNNKIIQAYYYDEVYTETETTVSEYYMYCENSKVFSVWGKEDTGDDKVVDTFEDIEFEEYDIEESDTYDITEAVEFFKTAKANDDLDEWFCLGDE